MSDNGVAAEPAEIPEAESAYTKAEQAHYQQIREMNKEVSKLEAIHLGKKEAAAAAKKRYEAASEELGGFISRGPDLQQKLPGMDAGNVDREAWRELPLSELAISEKVVEKLGLDLNTLGKLSDLMSEELWYQDIDGIGGAIAQKIGDVFADFWQTHPEYCEGGTDDTETDDTETKPEDTET